ncbi:hypothetical protein MKX01_029120, partial [Papaver californicum]
MEVSRNISWPFSRSRTHVFLVSLFLLGLVSYLSARNSPTVVVGGITTITSSTRILFSNIISAKFIFNYSQNNQTISFEYTHQNQTHNSSIPVEETHKNSTNSVQLKPQNLTTANFSSVQLKPQNSTATRKFSLIENLKYCDIFNGRWVLDDSKQKPAAYEPGSCPFLDDAFNCFKNGRPDSDYLRLRWKPHGCQIP